MALFLSTFPIHYFLSPLGEHEGEEGCDRNGLRGYERAKDGREKLVVAKVVDEKRSYDDEGLGRLVFPSRQNLGTKEKKREREGQKSGKER